MVCELQGISMKPFISAIKRVLREYETKPCDRSGQQMSIFDIMKPGDNNGREES